MADAICQRCQGPITGDDLRGLDLEGLLVGEGVHRRCMTLAEEIEETKRARDEARRASQALAKQALAEREREAELDKRLGSLREHQEQVRKVAVPTTKGEDG